MCIWIISLDITTVSLMFHALVKSQLLPHTAGGLGQTCEYETQCKYSSIAHAVSSIGSC